MNHIDGSFEAARGADRTARAEAAPMRFLRYARHCREIDLGRLAVVAELVGSVNELVHALQRERGISAVFLGSSGVLFAERRAEQAAGSEPLERRVAARLESIDGRLDPRALGPGFHTRIAGACLALESLVRVREQTVAFVTAPRHAVESFTDIIGAMLAVGFEAANFAADAELSRLSIALVSLSQGKEYAGQERATAAAWLSRGRSDPAERRRLAHLQTAQERAFRVFSQYAGAEHLEAHRAVMGGLGSASGAAAGDGAELDRMRALMLAGRRGAPLPVPVERWFELTTRRIDRMRTIEARLAADLGHLCAAKLAESRADGAAPATGQGIGLQRLEQALPLSMRSMLEVIDAQSRHVEELQSELDAARSALARRKTVERAKGVLMKSRRLSEEDAYSLMRKAAMRSNKRLHEVAEAILGMTDPSRQRLKDP